MSNSHGNKNGLLNKLLGFMIGRNGFDDICKALLILYAALAIPNIVIGSVILWCVDVVIACYIWFRVLSKNIYKRQKENMAFLVFKKKFRTIFRKHKLMWKERKYSAFRRCPSCKNTLRLPKRDGKHSVCCPCCGEEFEVRI